MRKTIPHPKLQWEILLWNRECIKPETLPKSCHSVTQTQAKQSDVQYSSSKEIIYIYYLIQLINFIIMPT